MAGRGFLCVAALVAVCSTAWGQSHLETFAQSVNVVDGTTFGGSCNSIVARLGNNGNMFTGGGKAILSAPSDSDAALLATTTTLPDAPYKMRIKLESLLVPQGTGDNAVVLFGLYDWAPTCQPAASWVGHGVLEITAKARWDSVSGVPHEVVSIDYWTSGGWGFTWDGSNWAIEADDVFTFEIGSATDFEITVERTTTELSITITSAGGGTHAAATLPLTQLPSSPVWAMSGFPHTNSGHGSITYDEIEIPWLCTSGDGGPGDGGSTDGGGPMSDGGGPTGDGGPMGDGGPTGDGSNSDGSADGADDGGQLDAADGALDAENVDAGVEDTRPDGQDSAPRDVAIDSTSTLDSSYADDAKAEASSAGDDSAVQAAGSGCDCHVASFEKRDVLTLALLSLFVLAASRRRRRGQRRG